MIAYRAECDSCRWRGAPTDEVTAKRDLADHVCQPRCGLCGAFVPILVDEGSLCIRCDALVYPSAS